MAKAIQTIFQSGQIAVLTVARQQAHHKLSVDIIFSPQLSTSSSGRPIQTMPFRQSEPFRQCYSDTPGMFLCDPKITAFFRIKLLVSFFFELFRLGPHSYSDNDNEVVDPLDA